MGVIKSFNLLVAFLLEICLLVIFGFWGVTVSNSLFPKIVLGVGLPLVLALIWGRFLAPASTTRLHEPWLMTAKLVIFFLAALALYSIGKPTEAGWFGVISLINLMLLFIWKQ